MLKSLLPKFKVVEPELLKGQYGGLYVSQRPVNYTAAAGATPESYGVPTVTKNDVKFVENGIICSFNNAGEVVQYDHVARQMNTGASAGTDPVYEKILPPMYIHYTEELPTIVKAYDTYAVECAQAETYIRLIQLFSGDEFVTNNVDATTTGNFAKVVNGILTLQSAADKDTAFAVSADTLPNGEAAYRFVYIK